MPVGHQSRILSTTLEKNIKLDFRRKSVPEILMWNLSINNINNPINVRLIDGIVKH